jgi:hypothetical protein
MFWFSAEILTGKKFYRIRVAQRPVVFRFDESSVRHAAVTYNEGCGCEN